MFKLLREARDMSLEDAGKLLEVSRQYVFAIETGAVAKPVEYANLFAKKLKLNKAEKIELRKTLVRDYESMITF